MKNTFGIALKPQKQLNVYIKKIAIIALFIIISLPLNVLLATKTKVNAAKPIKIGASLNNYHKPSKKECDIKVPSQFNTIQAGIDAALAGDTVCVSAGTFNENIEIRKTIKLSGGGANNTFINGMTPDSTIYIAGDSNANNVIIEGFKVTGTDGIGLNDPATLNIGPFASGVIIRNNEIITGNAQLAIRMDSGQTNDLIYNNVIEGRNSQKLVMDSGVQGPSFKVDFVSNTFKGEVNQTNQDNGRVLDTWATDSSIQNNVFNTTGTTSILIASAYATNNVVSRNNFNSNIALKVGTYSGGVLKAEGNWWGDLDPSDNIHGDIDYTPFATKPYAEN